MRLFKFLATLSALLFLADVPGSAQIEQPRLGYMLDSGHMLRPVFGIAASASLGGLALANTISFACSSTLCLAKKEDAIVAFAPAKQSAGFAAAPPVVTPCSCIGPALIAVDSASIADRAAWIYLEATRQLARWHDSTLDLIDFSPDGEIVSMRATADGFDYAIVRESLGRRESTTWIEHYSASDGSVAILDSVEGTGPVILLDSGVLLASPGHVTLRRADGQELTFPQIGAEKFQTAGDGYVEILANEEMWMLRTDAGNEQLSMLPGIPQGENARVTRVRRTPPRAVTGAAIE